ncbi:MAG: phosphate--acyl-ACP acyltransferase, partial [Syntrophomonadaceae bacterium]|nr:phosphate--acyl-ACP acyltransferase [Syntrophomonadaceae bacterium]
QKSLNFIGNIEGRDLFNQTADVIVCDGFIGNIVLKTVEGLAGFIIENLLKETPSLPSFFKKLDYTQVGGAPLLGVKGISIVCHGSSRSEAIYNGINVAKSCFDNDIVALQEEKLLDL